MLTYKIYTNRGSRDCNEDAAGAIGDGDRFCCMVADGLGGQRGGQYASAIAAETVQNVFGSDSGGESSEFLARCFTEAQKNVLNQQAASSRMNDMSTTMTVLYICGGKAQWGHIGDSRVYHFNRRKLMSRTLDHSVPQMLVNMGEIKEKDIRGHEDRNKLLRAIGNSWETHSYDISDEIKLGRFDAFLLCSDGFWEFIDEKAMSSLLKKARSVEEWLDSMAELVRENGKNKEMDNNTAIAVWTEGDR